MEFMVVVYIISSNVSPHDFEIVNAGRFIRKLFNWAYIYLLRCANLKIIKN